MNMKELATKLRVILGPFLSTQEKVMLFRNRCFQLHDLAFKRDLQLSVTH